MRTYMPPGWGVSTHCAVAAREGNDVFYYNICPGATRGALINFNSPVAQQPKVSVSGSHYTV